MANLALSTLSANLFRYCVKNTNLLQIFVNYASIVLRASAFINVYADTHDFLVIGSVAKAPLCDDIQRSDGDGRETNHLARVIEN